jgi:hypothetical protein
MISLKKRALDLEAKLWIDKEHSVAMSSDDKINN